MASTYISRSTASGTDTVWTWSGWLKRSNLSSSQTFFGTGNGSSSANSLQIRFSDDDTLDYRNFVSSSYNGRLSGGRKYRDTSAWYHFVFVWDTTQASSGNRMKAYCNGEIITGFTDIQDPGINSSAHTSGSSTFIGTDGYGGSTYFDGCLSHVHFIDGTAYDPTAFGETDATTGEWEIKTSPSVTYGTNGFFVLKDGNSVTDQSGEGNNFTVGGGTLTKTEDCPSNVFATMNALSKSLSNVVLSKGNTICRNDASADGNVLGTIALGNGKYYWETYKHGGGNTGLGITLASVDGSNHSAVHSYRVNYYADGYIYQNGFGLSDINTGVTYGDTDIIGVSVDTESGTIKFYKNGVLVNNSSQTNAVFTYAQNELIPFWYCSNGGEWRTNFGNGYFGTTAVSSAGTNASGNGIFEYDVPTGFTALSTKGLNL